MGTISFTGWDQQAAPWKRLAKQMRQRVGCQLCYKYHLEDITLTYLEMQKVF